MREDGSLRIEGVSQCELGACSPYTIGDNLVYWLSDAYVDPTVRGASVGSAK